MLTVALKVKNPPAPGDRWSFRYGPKTPQITYWNLWHDTVHAFLTDTLWWDLEDDTRYINVFVFNYATGMSSYEFETTTPFVFEDQKTYIWDCATNSLSLEAPAPVPLKPIDALFALVWDFVDLLRGWADNIWSWIPYHEWFHDRLYDISDWVWSLLTHISHFGDWVDDVAAEVANILSSVDIIALLKTWLTYAEDAWNWIQDAANIISTYITSWWSTAALTVQGWIDTALDTATTLIDGVSTSLATLQTAWDDFWTLILPTLITSLDASTLIDSTLKVWFPFYDDLVKIWDEIKLFFTNPLDYLLDKFTDWFLGKE